ncbi:nitrate- and nitrite sensing domain-containing protein [Actinomadura vinacea]|uniref:histidine kinase n=1 Tax=Actinomadura vinacea TaxID=115336 RepID=A0ABN3ICV9_9ACTN
MPKREKVQGSHHRRRTRSVRQRIALLLALPLVAVVSLWAFAAGITSSAALQRFDYSTMLERIGVPISVAAQAVQHERAAAAGALGARGGRAAQRFQEQVRKTDAALAAYRKSAFADDAQDALDQATAQRLRGIDRAFEDLGRLRSQVDSRTVTALECIDAYSGVSDRTIQLLGTLVNVNDTDVYQKSRALVDAFWAQDFLLREDALVASLPASGRMSAAEYAAFVKWAGNHAQFFALARTGLSGESSKILETLWASPQYASVRTLETGIVRDRAVSGADEWRNATATLTPAWTRSTTQAARMVDRDQIQPVARRITLRFALVCGGGLLVVFASVVFSLLFARNLAGELRSLQRTAQQLAHERLPQVVARLRRGEPVDVDSEAPPPATGRTREIVLVAQAFGAVQRTAVSTAVGEAELRGSINKVFVNLSWRSQSLLHRQLRLLDAMESRASSPEELDDLFRLDHLTTRMRRHAEGLVILSGSPTVRAWDHPVIAEDVVRAAIAEVENYRRVEVVGAPAAAIGGEVVADVIHLLAELIENATEFSPPDTEVTVKIESVASGLVVEVVDRGLGIHPLQRDELNRRLAEPVEFELADTDRLGLFVVARLAAQHGVRVSLQASPYGGTSAIVLIPNRLIASGDQSVAAVARPGTAVNGTARPDAFAGTAPRPLRRERPSRPAVAEWPPESPAAGTPGWAPTVADRPAPGAKQGGAPPEESSEVTGVLPKRVRRSHMSPRLRDSAPRHAREPEEPDDFEEPSPELSRDLMASLQSGWRRGREDEDETNDPHGHWEES